MSRKRYKKREKERERERERERARERERMRERLRCGVTTCMLLQCRTYPRLYIYEYVDAQRGICIYRFCLFAQGSEANCFVLREERAGDRVEGEGVWGAG